MVRRAKEQRILLAQERGLELGLPKRHAQVLARVSFRRNLDGRVRELMRRYPGYKDMTQAYRAMCEDPTAFYYEHRRADFGSKRFSTYGSLSRMYSYASPVQVMLTLIEDALIIRAMVRLDREEGVTYRRGEEYQPGFFEDQQFRRLEQAWRRDIEGNNIPTDLIDTLLTALHWEEEIPYYPQFDVIDTSRSAIMDAFYAYFSSEEGDYFIEEWKRDNNREGLVDLFTFRFYNDPRVNLSLTASSLSQIGSPIFVRRCAEYGDDVVYTSTGIPSRTADIDLRYRGEVRSINPTKRRAYMEPKWFPRRECK